MDDGTGISQRLDARGDYCPMPIVKTAKLLSAIAVRRSRSPRPTRRPPVHDSASPTASSATAATMMKP